MERSEILTFAAWGCGVVLFVGAGCAAVAAIWSLAWPCFALGLVLLGLGGIRPLGALLWHGLAETAEIAAEDEAARREGTQ